VFPILFLIDFFVYLNVLSEENGLGERELTLAI